MPAYRNRTALAAKTLPLRILARRGGQGFTMIELVVMMIVIGILAVTVLPKFNLLSGFNEIGYRDKVKAALEFARKSAMAQRRYACAVIDASSDVTLTIETVIPESSASTCPRVLSLPAPDGSCGGGVTNKVCHPNNVTLTPAATLRFSPSGVPVSGVGTYTVTGDATWSITVEAETGYVH